jgi:hypothetical protein
MVRRVLLTASACLAMLAAPAVVAAQTTGSLAGTIRDSSGAVLPGVTVTVTGRALQRENASAVTDNGGAYRIPLLPPGVYEVVAELSGFAPQRRSNVEVALNQTTTLEFQLTVAGVA